MHTKFLSFLHFFSFLQTINFIFVFSIQICMTGKNFVPKICMSPKQKKIPFSNVRNKLFCFIYSVFQASSHYHAGILSCSLALSFYNFGQINTRYTKTHKIVFFYVRIYTKINLSAKNKFLSTTLLILVSFNLNPFFCVTFYCQERTFLSLKCIIEPIRNCVNY